MICGLRSVVWGRWFGNLCLGIFGVGSLVLGSLVWNRWFGIFGSGSLVLDLRFGIFGSECLFQDLRFCDLWCGVFGLGSFGLCSLVRALRSDIFGLGFSV